MSWAEIWIRFANAGKLAFGSLAGYPDLFGLVLLAVVLVAERNMGIPTEVMMYSVIVLIPILVLADLLSPVFMWISFLIFAYYAGSALYNMMR